ncbi:MAG: LuxR family transcriptional regulator [Marinisporobacter sp.]|jgi:DNA-binding CsgD family transcriptional regulator|nr:LuxR family transcriptional regulator [Marinisporobacter sp.]
MHIKKYINDPLLIITKSLNYAIILIFPAFGPVINKASNIDSGVIFGSFFLFFLLMSILIPPKAYENKKYYMESLIIICSLLTALFNFLPETLKFLYLALLGYTSGRITVFWSYLFLKNTHKDQFVQIISSVLFISYFLLYISNAITPSLSTNLAIFFMVLLFIIMFFCYKKTFKDHLVFSTKTKAHAATNNIDFPYSLFIVIFLIFLTAGNTYAGIYPNLKRYELWERYYNVFPFLLAILSSRFIAKRWGYEIFLHLGICFLGLSFIFNTLNPSTSTYLLIQTSLQVGWAFMDIFVWVVGAHVAVHNNRPQLLLYFIVSFLSGTFIGSIITTFFKNYLLSNYGLVSNFLTHLPIFIAIIFLNKVSKYLSNLSIASETVIEPIDLFENEIFIPLTPREKEVIRLLSKNMPNTIICEELFISPNTLKTHSRNIYRKINVKNKRELVSLIHQMQNHNL